jgi:hypothetical protein
MQEENDFSSFFFVFFGFSNMFVNLALRRKRTQTISKLYSVDDRKKTKSASQTWLLSKSQRKKSHTHTHCIQQTKVVLFKF